VIASSARTNDAGWVRLSCVFGHDETDSGQSREQVLQIQRGHAAVQCMGDEGSCRCCDDQNSGGGSSQIRHRDDLCDRRNVGEIAGAEPSYKFCDFHKFQKILPPPVLVLPS
jgi:hypothetical protein